MQRRHRAGTDPAGKTITDHEVRTRLQRLHEGGHAQPVVGIVGIGHHGATEVGLANGYAQSLRELPAQVARRAIEGTDERKAGEDGVSGHDSGLLFCVRTGSIQ